MRPYIFSRLKHSKTGITWMQGGLNITFEIKKLRYGFLKQKTSVRSFSSLSFEYEFQEADDEVFFAYSIPYTYSAMLADLRTIQPHPIQLDQSTQSKVFEWTHMGKSLMGVPIPLARVTDPKTHDSSKRVVFVTGRIHPGEPNGSLMLLGFINHILSTDSEELLRKTIFYIIPMINPDGVIMGNYRTGLSGRDLNRVYTRREFDMYPEIYHVREIISKITMIKQIHMFLDFHGHSNKKNTFVYGPQYPLGEPEYYKAKVFPKMLAKNTPMFRFHSCVFRIAAAKRQTARAVMLQHYGIPYFYTVESSNGSYYDAWSRLTVDYNRRSWEIMGETFSSSLLEYFIMLEEYEKIMALKRQAFLNKKKDSKKRYGNINSTALSTTTIQSSISNHNNKSVRSRDMEVFQQFSKEDYSGSSFQLSSMFLNFVQEIKKEDLTAKIGGQDSDIDSDSNDPQEDMDSKRFSTFNIFVSNNFKNLAKTITTLKSIVIDGEDNSSKKNGKSKKEEGKIRRDKKPPLKTGTTIQSKSVRKQSMQIQNDFPEISIIERGKLSETVNITKNRTNTEHRNRQVISPTRQPLYSSPIRVQRTEASPEKDLEIQVLSGDNNNSVSLLKDNANKLEMKQMVWHFPAESIQVYQSHQKRAQDMRRGKSLRHNTHSFKKIAASKQKQSRDEPVTSNRTSFSRGCKTAYSDKRSSFQFDSSQATLQQNVFNFTVQDTSNQIFTLPQNTRSLFDSKRKNMKNQTPFSRKEHTAVSNYISPLTQMLLMETSSVQLARNKKQYGSLQKASSRELQNSNQYMPYRDRNKETVSSGLSGMIETSKKVRTGFPSSCYRIKQQLQNKRKDEICASVRPEVDPQLEILTLNVKKFEF